MPGQNDALVRAYLGLGGNIGDPAASMAAALRALDGASRVKVVAVSSLYRTPPWGLTDQPDFLNAVAAVDVRLQARALLELCLAVESSLKRVRDIRWGPRLIDIDILLFGEARIADDDLQIPHPRMLERAFVMLPLAEIADDVIIEGRPVRDWAFELDAEGIDKLDGNLAWWRA